MYQRYIKGRGRESKARQEFKKESLDRAVALQCLATREQKITSIKS
jgi:hypothetical protein